MFAIPTHSTPYPDEFNLDIIGGTYDNLLVTPTFRKNFAFNLNTISATPIGDSTNTKDVKISLSNYWNGDTVNGNLDGSKFSAFIRVIGFLPTSSLATVKKIIIFFDKLTVYPKVSGSL